MSGLNGRKLHEEGAVTPITLLSRRQAYNAEMDDTRNETDGELLERGRVLKVQAEELFRVAAIIREQAQKLMDQAEKTARLLAANRALRVK